MSTQFKLKLEINENHIDGTMRGAIGGMGVQLCPVVNAEYWLFCVSLTKHQAVVGFHKFGTIGIGFQHEEDWNTNLPYTCATDEIVSHIEHNAGDEAITREQIAAAVRLIQDAAGSMRGDS